MIFEKIRTIIADVLEVDPETITLETRINDDLKADSLDLFKIVNEIEDTFNIKIEYAEVIETVEDAVKFVEEQTK
ncbi:MAG: acyl carrier protein [Eubacterium sp.]|nr:acyl carrier protein [Eubacterium sp.]MCD7855540.1 acyl carrier protein [Clostridiales bacterium]MCD8238571.1 acyl carrier protein [Clostridiales bacterium]